MFGTSSTNIRVKFGGLVTFPIISVISVKLLTSCCKNVRLSSVFVAAYQLRSDQMTTVSKTADVYETHNLKKASTIERYANVCA